MTHIEAPTNPRTYLRQRIENVRREVEALRAQPGSSRWLAQDKEELEVLEAELAAIERRRLDESDPAQD